MADIERKNGVFDPPETEGDMAVLTGKGPVVNLRDYQREVTAYTKGRGRLSLWYRDYEPATMRRRSSARQDMIRRQTWKIQPVLYSAPMEPVLWYPGIRWRTICIWKVL